MFPRKRILFYLCNLATEPPPLFPFFFVLSIFFTDILSSAILAWSLWQHVTLSLSSEQYSFVRLVSTSQVRLIYMFYFSLILIFPSCHRIVFMFLFGHPWPVCVCVRHLALSRYELLVHFYCSYSKFLIPMFLHRNHTTLKSLKTTHTHFTLHVTFLSHVPTVIYIHFVEAEKFLESIRFQ